MFRGTQVWPLPKAWVLPLTDKDYTHDAGIGWLANVPDLTSKPAPLKGSLLINGYLTTTDDLAVNFVVFDGTAWVSSMASESATYAMPSHTVGRAPVVGGWWNSPTAAKDAQTFMEANFGGSTQLWVVAWAEPDGIHCVLQDYDGKTKTDIIDPYPPGVTM